MARKWGYDPTISCILKDEYLVDDPRSERPSVLIEEQKKDLVTSVKKDRNNREKSAQCIAFEHGVSKSTVLWVLHAANLHKQKPTTMDDKENWVRRTEDEQQQSQQYVGVTARVKEAAEVVEAVEAVEAVDNDAEDVNESEWGSDVAIDLW